MKRAVLKDLKMTDRKDVTAFLKKLWTGDGAPCPICGQPLGLLHGKAKKNDCDWQCAACGLVFRTIHLMDEMNEKMP